MKSPFRETIMNVSAAKISAKLFASFLLLFLGMSFLLPVPARASETEEMTNTQDIRPDLPNRMGHFSIAIRGDINFTRAPSDLRVTAVVGTPYIWNETFSLKGFVGQGLYKGITDSTSNSNETSAGYTAFGGGICVAIGQMLPIARPYFEAGWIGIIPSGIFTSEKFAWGLYGLIGFDILFRPGDFWGFFIETGVAGFLSGGIADRMIGDMAYGSGILINFGFRFYL